MCGSSLKYSFNGSFEQSPGPAFTLCSFTYVIIGIKMKKYSNYCKKEEVPSETITFIFVF